MDLTKETYEASPAPALSKPHAVVLPIPARGHVNPMMQFSKLLAAQGVSVTFINSEYNDKLLQESEKDALRRLGIRLETLPDGLPPHADRTNVPDLCVAMLSAMPQPFEALLARLFGQQPRPSCIVADTWLPFTVPAAAKFALPHASFWTQSATSFASLLMIANGAYGGPSQGEPNIPGAMFLKEEDMHTFIRCYDRSNYMFRFTTNGFDCLNQSHWIFINTFQELEFETLQALSEHTQHIHAIGPLLTPSLLTYNNENEGSAFYPQSNDISSIWIEEESCLNWLNQFEPKSVLYVSFGSLASITAKQIEEIALGLEASGSPFLWVTRPDLVYGESPNFKEEFFTRVKERAYFVSWAPQLKVLSHKAVGGFFTHGGWNSTLEGISIGVPMLGCPFFADQPMNCKCIEEGWNTGSSIRHGVSEMLVSRDVVEAKVKELMSSHKFVKKAYDWSPLAKKAALRGGSSFKNLQDFVKSLMHLNVEVTQ